MRDQAIPAFDFWRFTQLKEDQMENTLTNANESTILYAQPYDLCAHGFYFSSYEQYETLSKKLRNDYGDPVEEFEIQIIDAEDIDVSLFNALGIHQGNVDAFLELSDEWTDDQKIRAIIAIGEVGYSFNLREDDPDDFDLDLYEMNSLRDLAHYFVDEGLFGDIPERLQFYINYDAIARDLGMDYSEITIAGMNLIYRCG
jgi:hypothetical protein